MGGGGGGAALIAGNRRDSANPKLTAEGGGATRSYLKPTAIWDHPGMIVGKSFGILVEG